MQAEEFRHAAMYSAKEYYNYLHANHKGRSTTPVRRLSFDGKQVILYLSGAFSPYGLESTLFQIYEKEYTAQQMGVSDYDRDLGCLRLFPEQEFLPLFQKLQPSDIRLNSDLTFLVSRVHNWYQANGGMIHLPRKSPDIPIPEKDTLAGGEASDEQYTAVVGALSSPFSYIWGAPGTGKTRFVLANCVLSYIRQGKKVLLLAPTNNAVEQMLSGVLDVLRTQGISDHLVFRYGLASREFCAKYPSVCEGSAFQHYKSILEQRVKSLTTRLQTYDRLDQLQALYSSVSDLIPVATARDALLHQISETKKKQRRLSSEADTLFKEILSHRKDLSDFDIWSVSFPGRLCRFFRPNYYSSLLHGRESLKTFLAGREQSYSDVSDDLSDAKSQLADLTEELSSTEKSFHSLHHSLCALLRSTPIPDALKPAARSALDKSVSASTLTDIQEKLSSAVFLCQQELSAQKAGVSSPDALRSQLSSCQERLSSLETSFQRRIGDVLVHAMTIDRFIVSTVGGFSSVNSFHHIFLDEAAYTSLARGMTLLACDVPITLLGDHAQLPPICEMDQNKLLSDCSVDPAYLWSRSIVYAESMSRCNPCDLCGDGPDPVFLTLQRFPLTITYRFGPALASVLSRFSYSDYGLFSAAGRHISLFLIDCPRSWKDPPHTSSSEAAAAARLAAEFHESNSDYAILTPYRKQVALLSDTIPAAARAGRILTIHASQGREFDTLVISAVDATSPFFLNSDSPSGRSVLNTAVSRAKLRLILLADRDAWENRPDQMLTQLLQASTPYEITPVS